MTILQRTDYRVSDHGELVVLCLGNFRRSMEFQVALQFSALLRAEAKVAKFHSGHDFVRRNMAGILTNATPLRRLSRWRKALPERLSKHRIAAHAEGQLVAFTIAETTARMPYADAQKLAQALRLHGKLARNAAGERANWAELVA